MAKAQRIIAIGGGKGGVGKSLIAANLGIALAQHGRQVIVVDADLGSANLHSVLGMQAPQKTLSDFITRKNDDLAELVVNTGYASMGLLSGARDQADISNPMFQQKRRLLTHLAKLHCQDLILDLGAGTSYNVLDFLLLAQMGILVVTPEPTAQENALRFVKAASLRLIRSVQKVYGLQRLLKEAAAIKKLRGDIRSAPDLIKAVHALEPQAGKLLQNELQAFRPSIIINQWQDEVDRREGQNFAHSLEHDLGIKLQRVASVPFDLQVRKSLRRGRPLIIDSPDCPAAKAIKQIALDFLPKGDAAEQQVEQESSGRRVLVNKLIEVEEQDQRKKILRETEANNQVAHLPENEGYDGVSLRAIREARGLSLETLAAHTKISLAQLRAIESNHFSAFPARVYLRGFLYAYVRQLGLNTELVVHDYLAAYDAHVAAFESV